MKIETQKLGTPKAKLLNCLNKYQRPRKEKEKKNQRKETS